MSQELETFQFLGETLAFLPDRQQKMISGSMINSGYENGA